MSIDRLARVNELLKREIGQALFQVLDNDKIDLSAITITKVAASPNLRDAAVMVSIRNHEKQRGEMLRTLRNSRGRIQEIINRNLSLKFTPRLSFSLDTSIEKGDHILRILGELEKEPTQEETR